MKRSSRSRARGRADPGGVALSPKVAQRGIALAAIALLAVVVGFAIASRDGSSSGDALPERVGEWYTARAAPMDVRARRHDDCLRRSARIEDARNLRSRDPMRGEDLHRLRRSGRPHPGDRHRAWAGRGAFRPHSATRADARHRADRDDPVELCARRLEWTGARPCTWPRRKMLNQHHCIGSPRPASLRA